MKHTKQQAEARRIEIIEMLNAGMTQNEIADKLGMKQSAVSKAKTDYEAQQLRIVAMKVLWMLEKERLNTVQEARELLRSALGGL